MGLYKYLASERGGQPEEVLIEAENQREALEKLRSRGAIPINYLGEASLENVGKHSLFSNNIDALAFTRQLAPLLDSYIPLERALSIIAEGSDNDDQRQFVNSLRQGLHEGKKFSELIRSRGNIFPSYYANLIESGEETGCLPEVVNQLYKFMTESKELKDFIVSSSIYPAAILCVTLVVTILLFTVFVPKFAKVFQDMGRETPASINMLLSIGDALSFWWIIPILIFAGWQIAVHSIGKEKINWYISLFKLKIPLSGRILSDLEMCRYLRTLSILSVNHVEIIRTVEISRKVLKNPVVSESFKDVPKSLKGGAKLSAALSDNPYIPKEMVPMLRVGEESGNVSDMVTRIADHLESDTRLKIKRLLSLFEPAVIVFLALMVLIVVISIFTAMMEMNSIQGGNGI